MPQKRIQQATAGFWTNTQRIGYVLFGSDGDEKALAAPKGGEATHFDAQAAFSIELR